MMYTVCRQCRQRQRMQRIPSANMPAFVTLQRQLEIVPPLGTKCPSPWDNRKNAGFFDQNKGLYGVLDNKDWHETNGFAYIVYTMPTLLNSLILL